MLSRERRVLVLQIEALRAQAQQAERELQDQHLRHQTELRCLRDESLQVRGSRFRAIWRMLMLSKLVKFPYNLSQCSIILSRNKQEPTEHSKVAPNAAKNIKNTSSITFKFVIKYLGNASDPFSGWCVGVPGVPPAQWGATEDVRGQIQERSNGGCAGRSLPLCTEPAAAGWQQATP